MLSKSIHNGFVSFLSHCILLVRQLEGLALAPRSLTTVQLTPSLGHHNQNETMIATTSFVYSQLEGLALVLRSLTTVQLTPSLETPRYIVLRRTGDYEVRYFILSSSKRHVLQMEMPLFTVLRRTGDHRVSLFQIIPRACPDPVGLVHISCCQAGRCSTSEAYQRLCFSTSTCTSIH